MGIDFEGLKEICRIPGAPGFENNIRNHVSGIIDGSVDEKSTDSMGNLITIKRCGTPNAKKVMLAAHLDEIGFIVTHITDDGFLRFHPLGGFDPKTLTSQRVIVHGKKDLIGVMGSKPIHVMKPEERKKTVELGDFYIDLGLSGEEVKKHVEIGDAVTRDRELIRMGECLNGKSLDNRISVYILTEVMKRVKAKGVDVYGVFTVQEEVGIRGAQVATLAIQPDFGIAIDTTIAFDLPGSADHEKITELGKGTAIKIYDTSAICDRRMIRFLKQTAENNKVNWQTELLTGGGTDTAGIQRFKAGGSIAGAVSIPTRHIHQTIEMVHEKDVEASIELLIHAIEGISEFNWEA